MRSLIESSPSSCDVLKKSPDRIITELEREIIREWNKGVTNDLGTNPINDNELNGLPEDAVEAIRAGHSLNKVYGCTLIMCVVIDGFWFGIHIGDGKCVVAMNNGLYTQPIPWDEVGCVEIDQPQYAILIHLPDLDTYMEQIFRPVCLLHLTASMKVLTRAGLTDAITHWDIGFKHYRKKH